MAAGLVDGVLEWRRETRVAAQLPAALFTVLKVPLALVPRVVMIVMHATRIRASITAYSTAVGPSSLVPNREIERRMRDIGLVLQREKS